MPDVTTNTVTTIPTTPTGPSEIIAPSLPEPGWKTSEFWFKLLAIALAPIYASGMITNNVAESIVLMVITVLGAFGYGVNRSLVKAAASKATVTVVPLGTLAASNANEVVAPVVKRASGSLVLVAVLAIGAGAASQTACTPAVVTAGGIVFDCLAQDQAHLVDLVGSLWSAFTSSGSWKEVEDLAIANGKTLGGCAIAEVVQKYLTPPRGRAAPPAEQGQLARATLEHFRTTQAGGATFRTASGDL